MKSLNRAKALPVKPFLKRPQGSQEQQQEQSRRDSKMFSLAEPQPPAQKQPVAYADPEYIQYNPNYNGENREPV